MGRTACTETQCLYSRAIPLLPLWAVRPVQSLSACTRMHFIFTLTICWSQWPRGIRRRSAAARLLRLWVWIPLTAWTPICCECFVCVLSGRGFCDELITRPEESYRLWCVVVCDLETSWMRSPWTNGGCRARNKQNSYHIVTMFHLLLKNVLSPFYFPIPSNKHCILLIL
jgi:hypothetical protein